MFSWEHVSYENATHHTYVSGEEGLLGVSDKCQILCASMALWNGKDPILKERLFGLTGIEVSGSWKLEVKGKFQVNLFLI